MPRAALALTATLLFSDRADVVADPVFKPLTTRQRLERAGSRTAWVENRM